MRTGALYALGAAALFLATTALAATPTYPVNSVLVLGGSTYPLLPSQLDDLMTALRLTTGSSWTVQSQQPFFSGRYPYMPSESPVTCNSAEDFMMTEGMNCTSECALMAADIGPSASFAESTYVSGEITCCACAVTDVTSPPPPSPADVASPPSPAPAEVTVPSPPPPEEPTTVTVDLAPPPPAASAPPPPPPAEAAPVEASAPPPPPPAEAAPVEASAPPPPPPAEAAPVEASAPPPPPPAEAAPVEASATPPPPPAEAAPVEASAPPPPPPAEVAPVEASIAPPPPPAEVAPVEASTTPPSPPVEVAPVEASTPPPPPPARRRRLLQVAPDESRVGMEGAVDVNELAIMYRVLASDVFLPNPDGDSGSGETAAEQAPRVATAAAAAHARALLAVGDEGRRGRALLATSSDGATVFVQTMVAQKSLDDATSSVKEAVDSGMLLSQASGTGANTLWNLWTGTDGSYVISTPPVLAGTVLVAGAPSPPPPPPAPGSEWGALAAGGRTTAEVAGAAATGAFVGLCLLAAAGLGLARHRIRGRRAAAKSAVGRGDSGALGGDQVRVAGVASVAARVAGSARSTPFQLGRTSASGLVASSGASQRSDVYAAYGSARSGGTAGAWGAPSAPDPPKRVKARALEDPADPPTARLPPARGPLSRLANSFLPRRYVAVDLTRPSGAVPLTGGTGSSSDGSPMKGASSGELDEAVAAATGAPPARSVFSQPFSTGFPSDGLGLPEHDPHASSQGGWASRARDNRA